MSTDVERIINGLRLMHEFWANLIQVVIATYLLQRELGVACVAPIAVSIGRFLLKPSVIKIISTDLYLASVIGTFCLSSTATKKQAEWMEHIQKRVGKLQSLFMFECTAMLIILRNHINNDISYEGCQDGRSDAKVGRDHSKSPNRRSDVWV
jgi:hypothetical protein